MQIRAARVVFNYLGLIVCVWVSLPCMRATEIFRGFEKIATKHLNFSTCSINVFQYDLRPYAWYYRVKIYWTRSDFSAHQ